MFACPKTKINTVYKFSSGGSISDVLICDNGNLLITRHQSSEVLEVRVALETQEQSYPTEVRVFNTIHGATGIFAIAKTSRTGVLLLAGTDQTASTPPGNDIKLWTLSMGLGEKTESQVLSDGFSVPIKDHTGDITLLPLEADEGDVILIGNRTGTCYRVNTISKTYSKLDATSQAIQSMVGDRSLKHIRRHGTHIYAIHEDSRYLHRFEINPQTGNPVTSPQNFYKICENGFSADALALAFDTKGLAWILSWGGEQGDRTTVISPASHSSRSFAGLFGWDLLVAGSAILRFSPRGDTACIIEDTSSGIAILYMVEFLDKVEKKKEGESGSTGLDWLVRFVKKK